MSHKDHSEADDVSVRSAFDPGKVSGAASAAAESGDESFETDPERNRRGPRKDAGESDSSDSSGAQSRRDPEGGRKQPREGGRLSRITDETRGLAEDLKEWVDLKIQLLQLDFEDRIRQAANRAALTAVVIVVALLAVLFGLVAAGEALGAWFDNRSLGFLALAGVLALVAGIIHVMKPRLVDSARATDVDDTQNLLPDGKQATPALTEGSPKASSDKSTQSHDDR